MRKALLICLIAIAIASNADLDSIRNEILERHNFLRAQHQAGKLERDSQLEAMAQAQSEYLANTLKTLQYKEDKYNDEFVGQNLYKCLNCEASHAGKGALDYWYDDEAPVYDYKDPGFSQDTAQFTQIVWKSTKKLGCGIACNAEDKACYVLCYYYPHGNTDTLYGENVLPKTGSTEQVPPEEEPEENPEDPKHDDHDPLDKKDGEVDPKHEDHDPIDKKDGEEIDPEVEPEKFKEQLLNRHNFYRTRHQVGNLERDAKLEEIAQQAADTMAKEDNWYFTDQKYNGEDVQQNLIAFSGKINGESIVDSWYKGSLNYDFNKQGWSSETGGFTQMIWKATKKIGCASSLVKGQDKSYAVCVYYPAGNWEGEFEENVFPPL